jgi:hypothetical protein
MAEAIMAAPGVEVLAVEAVEVLAVEEAVEEAAAVEGAVFNF